jgi:Methylase involved in ubiquinone/menaquinone biosynthesis
MGLFDWFTGKNAQKQAKKQEGMVMSVPDSQEQMIAVDGRNVLVDLPYVLPKDMLESNRLDFQHFMLRTILGANYLAPIENPQNILDVGSGTGRWMTEMSQAFPAARLIGCDIAEPKNEAIKGLPTNAQFLQADILKGLSFPADYFDYVHQRLLFLAVPAIAWPGVIRELVRVTRPGGWVELAETQFCMKNMGPVLTQMLTWIVELSRKRGVDSWQAPDLEKEMQIAGLTNITYHRLDLPVGKWGGHVGTMMLTDGLTVADAMKPLVVSQLGVDPAEYDRLRALLADDYESHRTEMSFFVAYGQRPQ